MFVQNASNLYQGHCTHFVYRHKPGSTLINFVGLGYKALLKNKLVKFVVKRVLIFFIGLSIFALVCYEERWYALSGLLAGSIYSVLRLGSYAWVFGRLLFLDSGAVHKTGYASGNLTLFIFNQIALLPLLYLALKLNGTFFTGAVAGILLVPAVLFVNSITEALGITHNNFE